MNYEVGDKVWYRSKISILFLTQAIVELKLGSFDYVVRLSNGDPARAQKDQLKIRL